MNLLFTIWLLSATVQIIYLLYFHLKAAAYKNKFVPNREQQPVSIIICAKNEAHKLSINIPLLFEQNYSNFEIIVIDDGSTDSSLEILNKLASANERLTVYSIENTSPGKKEALAFGIEKAKYEWLLLTDADCEASSLNWIELMVQPLDEKIDIVLGLGPLNYKKGFLNGLQRFENVAVGLLYTGFSLRSQTYMGVGRNMAYKKSTYIRANGFESHKNITSGDDDLFISSAASGSNVAIQIANEARTYSDAPSTLLLWIKQKSRHQSTAFYYNSRIKFLLNTWYLSYALFFILGGILILNNCNIIYLILVYLVRQCLQIYCFKNINTGHRIKTNTLALLFYDWALLVFYFLSTILLIFRKSDEW